MQAIFALALALSAGDPYNSDAGKNAPAPAPVEMLERQSDGSVQRRIEYVKPKSDGYGNAAGNQYDLARDGAFKGQTVAVIQLYTGEGFDFSLPKAALAEKGFSVYRWMNAPPPVAELREKLKLASQLWIISTSSRTLSDEHVAVIKEFFDSGRGVYIWGDNEPYYADANVVGKALLGVEMHGNLIGDKVVEVQRETKSPGIIANHLLSTGLQTIYEGITIATVDQNASQSLKPLIYGSAGNLVAAVYESDGKRAIFDGGFTRLFLKWESAGTPRYVKNAAAWLANHERFGADKTASK